MGHMQNPTMHESLEEMVRLVSSEPKGVESISLADGTLLVKAGASVRKAQITQGNLHEIYAPLTSCDIQNLQALIGRVLPDDLQQFFLKCNGFSLFAGSLSVMGYVPRLSRDSAVFLPVSLEYGNSKELPDEDRTDSNIKDQIRFGFYSYGDGFAVAMNVCDGRSVFVTPRRRVGPALFTWPSLAHFITSETIR